MVERVGFMRPEESKEFQRFREDIIAKLGLTWQDWCWLWDKISIKCQLFEPKPPSGKLLEDEEVTAWMVENGKSGFMGDYAREAQRDLTASIVRAEVGEWLEGMCIGGTAHSSIYPSCIRRVCPECMRVLTDALKQGHTPDEVKRNTAANSEPGGE